jgi:hypothetical protein
LIDEHLERHNAVAMLAETLAASFQTGAHGVDLDGPAHPGCREEMSRMSTPTDGGGPRKVSSAKFRLRHGAFMSIQRAPPDVGPSHACCMPTGITLHAPGDSR